MPESFELSVIIPASPEQIYQAWLTSEEHSAITGSDANISSQIGARFSAWDGYITGNNKQLELNHRIVQSWRTNEFPMDSPDSYLEILLDKIEDGTRLTLIHNNLPDGQSEQYKEGWIEYYFKPLQRYFSV